jgi:hypothetical protein
VVRWVVWCGGVEVWRSNCLARLREDLRGIVHHPLDRQRLARHVSELAIGVRRTHKCSCKRVSQNAVSEAMYLRNTGHSSSLTSENHAEVLRRHEIDAAVARHAVQVDHERAERIVMVLRQFLEERTQCRVLVPSVADT